MKRLFSILGIIIFTSLLTCCGGSATSNSKETKIIGTTTQIGNIEIAEKDIPSIYVKYPSKSLNWKDANDACQKLGDGWRLPTKEELNIIYKNKDKIGGFAPASYWSSSDDGGGKFAWYQVFNFDKQNLGGKSFKMKVRAVRSL